MKVKQLINKLQNYDPELDIMLEAPNGLPLPPEVKIVLKDIHDVLNHSKDNTEYLILTW